MRVYSALLATALAVSSVSALRVNGWFPCGLSSTGSVKVDPALKPFECAEVDVPLCHEGICESDRTISLFVKRLPATAPYKKPKAMWMLQGGPGYSSLAMEPAMLRIHKHAHGTVSMYTVDHRGTGRSFFLECDAAQGFVGGSPDGAQLNLMETPNCLRDVLFQIDNQTAAFSVTSAAKDMELLVNELNAEDEDVYVYGASYGTYWTERLMHLAPERVKGYILDGVVAEDTMPFTSASSDLMTPAKQLAAYCAADEDCAAMFKDVVGQDGDVYKAWLDILKMLDATKPGDNACADLLRSDSFADPALNAISLSLKGALAALRGQQHGLYIQPAVLALMHRCQDEYDVAALSEILEINAEQDPLPEVYNTISDVSSILMNVIKVSEMWTEPSPSWDDELNSAAKSALSPPSAVDFANICLYSGDLTHPTCGALKIMPNVSIDEIEPVAFKYTPDQYHKKIATIPEHASVMVINGKLDFNTVSDYGVHQYEKMKGGRGKMMVDFDYGGHCVGIGATAPEDKTDCGFRMIASYAEKDGDVEAVDTSCLEELPDGFLPTADTVVSELAEDASDDEEGEVY